MKRQSKVMSIVAVVVCVVALTVGFAAFSNTLTISSSASVKPDASTFAVKFSTSANQLATNPVTAKTLNPSSLSSSAGTIDNSSNPTISGLSVGFTEPGQSAIYEFYVRNEGEYVAYLNAIQIGEKTCTPADGSESDSVNAACEGISVGVKVGAMDEVSATTTGITGQSLAKKGNDGDYATVYVTITYASSGTRADEEFSVKFGDIKLTYSTVTDFEVTDSTGTKICSAIAPIEQAIPTFESYGSMGTKVVGVQATEEAPYARGAVYSCDLGDGPRIFYVLENDTTNNQVSLIMNENLGDSVVWASSGDNSEGPVTANAALAERTSGWTKLTAVGGTAELPSYGMLGSEDWLIINLDGASSQYAAGYWTSTAHEGWDEDSSRHFAYIYHSGSGGTTSPCGVDGDGDPDNSAACGTSGIRPVITIPIEEL